MHVIALQIVAFITIGFTCMVAGYILGNTKGKGQGIQMGRISAFEEINRRA